MPPAKNGIRAASATASFETGSASSAGGPTLDRVFDVAYDDLNRVAARLVRRERRGHALQANELVNETYLRLAEDSRLEWQNRAHFFAIAARAMRQVLADDARRRNAKKRGGGREHISFDDQLGLRTSRQVESLDLEHALTRLEEKDERMALVVVLRFFSGLTATEVSRVLGVCRRTVQHDWRVARTWLARELSQ